MTAALFHKDLRLFRPVVWGAIAAGLLFWVVLPLAQTLQWRLQDSSSTSVQNSNWNETSLSEIWSWRVHEAARFVLPAGVVLAAAVGGMAFAAERRSRSAEFLAMLPVSRRRWVGTKLAAAALVCGLVFLANWSAVTVAEYGMQLYVRLPYSQIESSDVTRQLVGPPVRYAIVFLAFAWLLRKTPAGMRWSVAVILSLFSLAVILLVTDCAYWSNWTDRFGRSYPLARWVSYSESARVLLLFLPVMVAVFGLAWAISAVIKSPSFAATASIAVVLAFVFPWYTMTYAVEYEREQQMVVLYTLAGLQAAFGLLAISVGSIIQLKRQTP